MPRIIGIILLSLFYANALKAQDSIPPVRTVEEDTIPVVLLQEVNVYGKTRSKRYYKRYDRTKARLEYNVIKVYPYAKIAAAKIREIEAEIARTRNKAEQKKVIKKQYRELMKAFKKPLMKLSITQGRILIRLIYRETNHTSFAHIREYRGAFNAYFWQSIALLFGNNLKAAYDPAGEDREIEEIVQKIEGGEI